MRFLQPSKTLVSLILTAFTVGACSTFMTSTPLTQITISERLNTTTKACALNSRTSEQIKRFFINATKVKDKNLHLNSDYHHCALKGTGLYKKTRCNWEIRNEGTGTIQCDKHTSSYVCLDCF